MVASNNRVGKRQVNGNGVAAKASGEDGKTLPVVRPAAKPEPAEFDWRKEFKPFTNTIDVGGISVDDDLFVMTVPRHAIPSLARPGMIVLGHTDQSIIVSMTEQHCICKDMDGREWAYTWPEIQLSHVLPDPAYLGAGGHPGGITPQQRMARELVPILNRLKIWEGEGVGGDHREYGEMGDAMQKIINDLWVLAGQGETYSFATGEPFPGDE